MKATKKMQKYMLEEFSKVTHTTLNPKGPGSVRIHLIPPKTHEGDLQPSIAIINGQDIIPVNVAWSIVLNEFMQQVNKYDGKPLEDGDVDTILDETCRRVKKIFRFISSKKIKEDIYSMMKIFSDIAYGNELPEGIIEYISLGDYAPYMRAPHRMDIMVSAMTKEGKWHCNQKCVHCYAAGQTHSDEEEMSTEDWLKALDNLREIGVTQVTFTGGEPTMREDLFELIKHARWFVSRLNTNGIKLTKEYCESLREAELDSMQITFYSADADVHNKLVGANQYENTVAGIENALEAGLNVSINTPLCTLNSDYVKTLEFLKSKGIIYVTCSGLITTGNALTEDSERLQLTTEEITETLRKASDYCYENGMELSFTSPGWISPEVFEELGLSSPTCGACLSNMAITPGGNVVPCQSWLSGDTLGNILTDSWEDIWNNEKCSARRNYSSEMRGLCPLRYKKEEN